jgi:hypothetical protein
MGRILKITESVIKSLRRSIFLRRVKRFIGFLSWLRLIPSFYNVVLKKQNKDRRLLVIYDLSSQPFSIGEILVTQEAALVLRENEGIDLVDFALVYDLKHPVADSVHKSITENNYGYHLSSVLPAAQVNQHLGSYFVFNSHLQLQRFIADNNDLYYVWPSAWQFATREYLYYEVFNNLLYNYYKKNKTIPHLSCHPLFIEWARGFFRQHVFPDVSVSVNIRNNNIFHQHRNTNMEAWLDFFQYCEGRYPVKFVVVCALSEIDDRLRQHKNVLLAKDFHTGIEQDLSLIQTSIFHMGASSGVEVMAVFNSKPYLSTNTGLIPNLYKDIIHDEGFLRFFFSGSLQRFALGTETAELLIAEFDRMWAAVDVDAWKLWANTDDRQTDELSSWLR